MYLERSDPFSISPTLSLTRSMSTTTTAPSSISEASKLIVCLWVGTRAGGTRGRVEQKLVRDRDTLCQEEHPISIFNSPKTTVPCNSFTRRTDHRFPFGKEYYSRLALLGLWREKLPIKSVDFSKKDDHCVNKECYHLMPELSYNESYGTGSTWSYLYCWALTVPV